MEQAAAGSRIVADTGDDDADMRLGETQADNSKPGTAELTQHVLRCFVPHTLIPCALGARAGSLPHKVGA